MNNRPLSDVVQVLSPLSTWKPIKPPISIQLTSATPDALYTTALPFTDPKLVMANIAYQEANYLGAIGLYTEAIESVLTIPHTLPRIVIEGLGIAFANRASAHLHVNDDRAATADLEKAIVLKTSAHRMSVVAILQLSRYYIHQLDLSQARRAWARLDQSTWDVILTEPQLRIDAEKISQALEWLMEMEKEVDRMRYKEDWDQVLSSISLVEVEGQRWGLDWPDKLPPAWSAWKTEAKAWLGYPEEAEAISRNCIDPRCFESLQHIWLRGLIEYSYGDLKTAAEKFEELHRLTKDTLYTELVKRLHNILGQILQIEQAIQDRSPDGISRISQLVTKLINEMSGHPIENAVRNDLRLLYIETCTTNSFVLRSDRWVSHCTGEVIRHVDHTLNIDIGLDYPRLISVSVEGIQDALLARQGKSMSLPMVESAYEAVKSKLETYTINTAQDLLKSSPLPKTRQSLSQEPHDEMLQKLSSALYLSKESFGYYKILGISRYASERDIKIAFRKNLLMYHPDKGGHHRYFQLLNEAYSTLVVKESRTAYDRRSENQKMAIHTLHRTIQKNKHTTYMNSRAEIY